MVYRGFIFLLYFVTLPFQGLIALAILVTSGHPILFQQTRVGRNGKHILIYKFRTMKNGAELLQDKYKKFNESHGPTFKIYNDPRFTSVGKFLSHTGLDELPQLWNVLCGDMALIGPRPLPVEEVQKLKPWMRERHVIRPGIISPAILTGNYHKDFEGWMKSDIKYAKTKNPIEDIGLVIQAFTFLASVFARELQKRQ